MDVDVVAGVIDAFFDSALDPREVVAKFNDASEVHVNRPLSAKQAKRQKREAQIGLASNILGLTAGTAALVGAAKNPALTRPMSTNGGPVTGRLGRYLKTAEGRARLYRAGAVGSVTLQAANTGGDIVANRVLGREAKKEVKKSVDEVIAARAAGQITTDQAIDLAAMAVEKGLASYLSIKATRAQTKLAPLGNAMRHPRKAYQAAKQNRAMRSYKTNIIAAQLPKVHMKTLVGIGVGGVAAGGAGGVVAGKKIEQRRIRRLIEQPPQPGPVTKGLTWTGEITKVDSDKRQVFGWCSLSEIDGEPVVDLQGDYAPIEEIEKSAYEYVISSRKGGDMHERDGDAPKHVANLVESFVVTPEKLEQMGLPGDSLPLGWWVGFKVDDDETWAKVKSGERTGFSIHGSGKRVEKML